MSAPKDLPALAQKRIDLLTSGFAGCVACFDQGRPFTGPSVYFYEQTLRRGREVGPWRLREDYRFAELAYATLTAWGMHRMGPVVTKLPDFETFRLAIRALIPKLEGVPQSILDICDNARALEVVIARLAPLVSDRSLTKARSPLVVNAKLLHFILPDLVPPIDRSYTLRFFFNSINISASTESVFATIYRGCARIAALNQRSIRILVSADGYMASSHGKVIDNAIVGFVRSGFRAPRTGNQRIYSIPVVKDADSYESDGPEPEDLDALYDEESDVESEEEEHSEYAWFDPDLDEWIEPEDEE